MTSSQIQVHPMNIVRSILFQAKHNPPAPAMCAPGAALNLISYNRLARFIPAPYRPPRADAPTWRPAIRSRSM